MVSLSLNPQYVHIKLGTRCSYLKKQNKIIEVNEQILNRFFNVFHTNEMYIKQFYNCLTNVQVLHGILT